MNFSCFLINKSQAQIRELIEEAMASMQRVTVISCAFDEKYSEEITMLMLTLSLLLELGRVVVVDVLVVVEFPRIGEVLLVFPSVYRLRLSSVPAGAVILTPCMAVTKINE
jgi:hypothetical protein